MLRWNPLILTAVKQRVFGAVGCLNATIEPICLHFVLKLKDLVTVTLVTCFLPSLCIAWEQICYWNVLICMVWHLLFVSFHFPPLPLQYSRGYLGLLMGLIIGSHALPGSLFTLTRHIFGSVKLPNCSSGPFCLCSHLPPSPFTMPGWAFGTVSVLNWSCGPFCNSRITYCLFPFCYLGAFFGTVKSSHLELQFLLLV